jgi:AAA family ATP:ADP antiporter
VQLHIRVFGKLNILLYYFIQTNLPNDSYRSFSTISHHPHCIEIKRTK